MLDVRIQHKQHGGRTVLERLQLGLQQGEFVSLLGASGCGKSTLLSIIAGLDRDWQGSVRLEGRSLSGPDQAIGLIFQELRLFPWLTVAENLCFSLPLDAVRREALEASLLETGLQGLETRLPKHLSGGQAQRVAIARGLMTRPRILLLDEPFSAVDALTRMKLQELLRRVARHHALTVLMVTHDIDEALYVSDRVLVLPPGGGPLLEDVAIPRERQRRRDDAALLPLKRSILDRLHAGASLL